MNYTATLALLFTFVFIVDVSAQYHMADHPANQSMSATLNGARVRLLELCEKNVTYTTTHKTANLDHAISSVLTEADVDYYDIFEICYNDIRNHKITLRDKSADKLLLNPNKFIILRCCSIKISDLRRTKFNHEATLAFISSIHPTDGFMTEKYQEGLDGCGILDIRVGKCEREGGANYPYKDKVEDAILRYIEYARSKKKKDRS